MFKNNPTPLPLSDASENEFGGRNGNSHTITTTVTQDRIDLQTSALSLHSYVSALGRSPFCKKPLSRVPLEIHHWATPAEQHNDIRGSGSIPMWQVMDTMTMEAVQLYDVNQHCMGSGSMRHR